MTPSHAIAPGLDPKGALFRNLPPEALYESAVRRQEGQIVARGLFISVTAPHTGRSPNDKFIVRQPESAQDIWWGPVNQPVTPEQAALLREDVLAYLSDQPELFVREGHRMSLPFTRAMVRAALDGSLEGVPTRTDPVFGVEVPTAVPGVPDRLLDPRGTWADPARYDAQATRLAGMFRDDFATLADGVDPAVREAGPRG